MHTNHCRTYKLQTTLYIDNLPYRMADRKTFKFELTSKKFLTFNSKEVQSDLSRWDLGNRISLATFSYNDFFKDYQAKEFTFDFFNDPNVQHNLQVSTFIIYYYE